MADIKVKDLTDTSSITVDNQLMVLTNDANNVVQNITVENFVSNVVSTDSSNGISVGTDKKLYVDNSDSGVTAGTYQYPQNLVVDSKGKITSVTAGSPGQIPPATSSVLGGVKIGAGVKVENDGTISVKTHNLFDFKWSDHLLNDIQWLRGDTFSWQDGSVYVTAYNHLVDDITGKSLQTETIAGYTISYYLADDGHKIAPDTEETDILNLYNDTGIAWYYILDTTNERFKFPRSKHNKYTTSLGVKGDGKTLGLTNGTISGGLAGGGPYGSSAHYNLELTNLGNAIGDLTGDRAVTGAFGVVQNSTNSGLITDNLQQDTDQYKYLYFYVGEYEQSAVEQTAGLNADLFNAKVDLNASNLNAQGQSLISGLPMLSDTYEKMTVGATGSTYTAPANGWFVAHGIGAASGVANSITLIINGTIQDAIPCVNNYQIGEVNNCTMIPVRKNDVVTMTYQSIQWSYSGYSNVGLFFVYAQGSESEA